jgi:hypothetical protein
MKRILGGNPEFDAKNVTQSWAGWGQVGSDSLCHNKWLKIHVSAQLSALKWVAG